MNNRYTAVLFDLDGTLTQSHPGILRSAAWALGQLGFPVPEKEVMRRFIGPPLFYSYTQFCGLSAQQAEQAVALYRTYYKENGIFDCEVFEGILPMLAKLKQNGFRLAVATSKPGPQAMLVLEHFGLLPYFEHVASPDESETHSGKADLILSALSVLNAEKSKVVMVGDTQYDAQGARGAGVPFLGVLYGYGTQEEMEQYGAVRFVQDVTALSKYLLAQP